MRDSIVDVLSAVPSGLILDATLGGGGHASAMLQAREDMSLIGIDRDPRARTAARDTLAPFGDRVQIVAGRFDQLRSLVASCDPHGPITGVLFDLGVSSPQLDEQDRGFSYRHDGPLDMRMNPEDEVTAATIVNTWDEREIERLLRDGADERFARRVAANIVRNRPITTTAQLAEVVTEAIPAATRRTGGHPAKRTFQAVRIAVNDELAQIEPAIGDAIALLAPDGRGVVLSYHSGEDRLAKRAIEEATTGGCTCPPRLPCACGAERLVTVIPPRMRRPSDEEIAKNPRSKSARMRCFERIDSGAPT